MSVKCARNACSAEGLFIHRDLPGLYCLACARKINEANGEEVVTHTVRTPDDGFGRYRTLTMTSDRAQMNRQIIEGDIRELQGRIDGLKRLLELNSRLL